MKIRMQTGSEPEERSDVGTIDRLATCYPRASVCVLILVAVISVDGSLAALIGLNDGLRIVLGRDVLWLMLIMPSPVVVITGCSTFVE